MRNTLRFGWSIIVVLPLAGQAKPSAAVPATFPTQSVSDLPSARLTAAPSTVQRGQVVWDGTLLTVHGNGEGLYELIRTVARQTGMKVTGSVPNDPVFGEYGPGSVQQVLASLFEGLPLNMLLVNRDPTKPKDLILTARTGGPTPPSPQPVATFDPGNEVNVSPEMPPRAGPHTSPNSFQGPQPVPGIQAVPNGTNGVPQPASLNGTTVNGIPVDANGTPQSPNGTRTPEQIFEELRKRQQQQTISPQ